MIKSDLAELRKELKRLAGRRTDAFWPLALCLLSLHENYPKYLRSSVKQAGIGKRKAYYLLSLARTLRTLDPSPNRLHDIGWTKLQIIAEELDSRNAAKKLEMAERNTVQQLKHRLLGRKSDHRRHCVLMYFRDSDYQVFSQAILRYGGKKTSRDLAGKEEALLKILKKA